jgi:hypothetical protein
MSEDQRSRGEQRRSQAITIILQLIMQGSKSSSAKLIIDLIPAESLLRTSLAL